VGVRANINIPRVRGEALASKITPLNRERVQEALNSLPYPQGSGLTAQRPRNTLPGFTIGTRAILRQAYLAS